MSEQVEIKPDAVPDLDDLLQCPVCYEIPSGQIFQCNEGHHVCGRCKMRLEVCPVCRALFFGTRNYAMEELIANVKKLRAFKLGGKVTTDLASENTTPGKEELSDAAENESENDEGSDLQTNLPPMRAPLACKGLFRCLSCKDGNGVRLPAARLLNHLRYFHSPELIEGKSENGEYIQAWQFSTTPRRIVTAVRVADMGIFFLIIEISNNVCAWLTMAASPWVAHEFNYTVTVSGNDREAIFSDCVWSVRSCEGSLKKRGHCLLVNGLDARALTAPVTISCKLTIRRTSPDQITQHTQPRAVLRVANRGNNQDTVNSQPTYDLEPFLQDLHNDMARVSRVIATLGREANALVRSRIDNSEEANELTGTSVEAESQPATQNNQLDNTEHTHMSRYARRRLRNRLRATLGVMEPPESQPSRQTPPAPASAAPRQTVSVSHGIPTAPAQSVPRQTRSVGHATPPALVPLAPRQIRPVDYTSPTASAPTEPRHIRPAGNTNGQPQSAPQPLPYLPPLQPLRASLPEPPAHAPTVAPPSSGGPSNGVTHNGNHARNNKKKRRQRR